MMAHNLPAALSHARSILQFDASHALANYVVGAARLLDGEVDLAEEALRRSLKAERLPEALNDLAWLLNGKGVLDEAESLAREAAESNPSMPQAWDTLGVVLLKQDKLDEAEEALEKALSLTQESIDTFLHMAQLQAAKGDKKHAREIMLMIADKTGRLSSEAKADYDRLQHELGDG
jgi:Tfp pilus assembly protein PilF